MSDKKKILLIPTTDHTVTSFSMTYKGMKEKFDIYFILDSVHIKSHHELSWATVLDVSSIKQFSVVPKWAKFLPLVLNALYYKLKLKEIFEQHDFSYVVVSNDRPLLQDKAISEAKKRKTTTITHQVASGIISDSISRTWGKKLKDVLIGLLTGQFKNVQYGGKCDYAFIMGSSWRDIVSERVPESSVRLVSNGFYYYFKDEFKRRTLGLKKAEVEDRLSLSAVKKKVVFFSQPFCEISLFTEQESLDIYRSVDELAQKLSEDFELLFKPHPQEKLYKQYDFNSDLKIIETFTPDESLLIADATLSVSSTMSLQSKLLDIPSFSLVPKFMPEKYVKTSKYFFHTDIDNIDVIDEVSHTEDESLESVIYRGLPPEESLNI